MYKAYLRISSWSDSISWYSRLCLCIQIVSRRTRTVTHRHAYTHTQTYIAFFRKFLIFAIVVVCRSLDSLRSAFDLITSFVRNKSVTSVLNKNAPVYFLSIFFPFKLCSCFHYHDTLRPFEISFLFKHFLVLRAGTGRSWIRMSGRSVYQRIR